MKKSDDYLQDEESDEDDSVSSRTLFDSAAVLKKGALMIFY